MSEIIGYIVMVCGGVIIALLSMVGALYTTFWALSRAWESIMWSSPDSGYEWERVSRHGYKSRLWFCGLRIGRFGVGIMGSKVISPPEKGMEQ